MKTFTYIAGPFFNPAQIALIEKIEELFTSKDVAFFSPRLSDASQELKAEGRMTRRIARRIFEINEEKLCECSAVLAVADWILPENEIVTWQNEVTGDRRVLNIPDTGTSWELGFARAIGKPVYLYRANPKGAVNLMLALSADGVIQSWEDLSAWVNCHRDWKGGLQ